MELWYVWVHAKTCAQTWCDVDCHTVGFEGHCPSHHRLGGPMIMIDFKLYAPERSGQGCKTHNSCSPSDKVLTGVMPFIKSAIGIILRVM
jgi:hypothetical protein